MGFLDVIGASTKEGGTKLGFVADHLIYILAWIWCEFGGWGLGDTIF